MRSVFNPLLVVVALLAVLLTSVAARAQSSLPPLTQSTLAMRTGVRLAYLQASATVGATGINLVPDANGNWVDVRTGKPYPEGTGTGGAGVSTFDVYAFDAQGAIVKRNDYLINTAINAITWANSGVLTGTPATNVAELWVNPSRLAAQPNVEQKDLRVRRIAYTLDGRRFSAIRIQANVGGAGWTQSTYDLQTGLLIIQSRATRLPQGGTGIAILRLLSGRNASLPGMGLTTPASIMAIRGYTWNVTGSNGVTGAGVVNGSGTLTWTNLRWTPRMLTLDVKLNGGNLGTMQYVAGELGGPSMSPNYLATLRVNQQIDAEPQLQYRVVVGQISGGFVTIYSVNKTGWVAYRYQISTGHLVGIFSQTQEGLLSTSKSITLVRRS